MLQNKPNITSFCTFYVTLQLKKIPFMGQKWINFEFCVHRHDEFDFSSLHKTGSSAWFDIEGYHLERSPKRLYIGTLDYQVNNT